MINQSGMMLLACCCCIIWSLKAVIDKALMAATCTASGTFQGALFLKLLLGRLAFGRSWCRSLHPVSVQLFRVQKRCMQPMYIYD